MIALALAGIAALGLAMLIYYGQYIPLILERTVPYFFQSRPAGPGQRGRPAARNLSDLPGAVHSAYRLLPPPGRVWPSAGAAAGGGEPGRPGRPRLRALLICWALVAALFTVAGSRIDMVDKQIFYLVPALALLAGRLLGPALAARAAGALGRREHLPIHLCRRAGSVVLPHYDNRQ